MLPPWSIVQFLTLPTIHFYFLNFDDGSVQEIEDSRVNDDGVWQ